MLNSLYKITFAVFKILHACDYKVIGHPFVFKKQLLFLRPEALGSNLCWDLILSTCYILIYLQDIADAAYVRSRGRPTPINLSVLVADLLFSVLLQAFFLIQVNLGQQQVMVTESNLSGQPP